MSCDNYTALLLEHELLHLAVQLASALLYCHQHRVAHRDVKLDNVFLQLPSGFQITDVSKNYTCARL